MKNKGLVLLGIFTGILLTIAFLWGGSASQAQAEVNRAQSSSTPVPNASLSDEGGTAVPLQADNSSDEFRRPVMRQTIWPQILSCRRPSRVRLLVYFVPTDNDATATVIYLYNTDTVAHVVALRGFNYDGAMVYAQNINIGASSFLRLISDSVAAAPPPSWATPAPITTNFTDFTYFASLSLPKGVKAEGYTFLIPAPGW